jgi:hypothetical protein
MAHDELPPLTDQSLRILQAVKQQLSFIDRDLSCTARRIFAAAVIREAINQAWPDRRGSCKLDRLGYLADNLHSPPPPPPTREQMEEALQHLIDMYGDRVAGESTDEHLKTLRVGIAHHCKVQP